MRELLAHEHAESGGPARVRTLGGPGMEGWRSRHAPEQRPAGGVGGPRQAQGTPLRQSTIAAKAECARSTVAEAIKALEFAGVLTWQNRITRIRERCRDLWSREGWRWRVIRTSNAYTND